MPFHILENDHLYKKKEVVVINLSQPAKAIICNDDENLNTKRKHEILSTRPELQTCGLNS